MAHTVIIFEPDEIPRFIANVTSLRAYKKNPNAVIDPKNLPTDEPLKYWTKGKKNRRIEVLTKKADKDKIDAKIKKKNDAKKIE
jgi:hypothetical protein